MPTVGSLLLISASAFVVVAFFLRQEQIKGHRLLLNKVRDWLDKKLTSIYGYCSRRVQSLVRHTIKLSWYYSIHRALRATLTLLVKLYDKLEVVFLRNRDRAKVLRAEKRALREPNHLTAIEEHKASTALTPAQKKKLRAKKLAGE